MHRDTKRNELRSIPDWLIGLVIAIVVVVSVAVYLRSIGAGDDPAFEVDTTESRAGDESGSAGISFALWDGSEAVLADFDGPLVLNFWASWCPACVAELPDFEAVSNEVLEGVTFIGMNVLPDDREAADRMISQSGVDYQLARDEGGELYTSFGAIAMPTTVFIAEDGTVLEVHSGALFEQDLQDLLGELFGV